MFVVVARVIEDCFLTAVLVCERNEFYQPDYSPRLGIPDKPHSEYCRASRLAFDPCLILKQVIIAV